MPKNEKNIFDHDILHVLPKRDQGGRRILVLELGSKLLIAVDNIQLVELIY